MCIMCGLENPKCRNRASKVHYPSNAIPIPAGCPWEEPASPLAAPQSSPCQLPGLCWHTWTWNSFLPSSSHPSHTALFIQPRVPGVLQHHIHHSLTTGTSSLLLSQQLLQHPRRNPDSCQPQSSAVTSQGAQRMHPRSGTRNCVCRGGAG